MKLIVREQYLDRMKALDQYLVKCLFFETTKKRYNIKGKYPHLVFVIEV